MLSGRDRDRLKDLHEAAKGHFMQREAGEELKLSERWVRKLIARLRKRVAQSPLVWDYAILPPKIRSLCSTPRH